MNANTDSSLQSCPRQVIAVFDVDDKGQIIPVTPVIIAPGTMSPLAISNFEQSVAAILKITTHPRTPSPTAVFALIALFSCFMQSLAIGEFLTPIISSWGVNGTTSDLVPGSSISVGVQLMGTRTNPQQTNFLDVNIYLSRTFDGTSAPAVYLGFISASIPGGQTSGANVNKTITLPNVYAGSATSAGTYYIVFSAVGITGSDVASTTVTIATPVIQVQQPFGTTLFDGISTISFGQRIVNTGTSTTLSFSITNTGVGRLTALNASIIGADANSFSITSPPNSSLNGGSGTALSIRFRPQTNSPVGTKTATLRITSSIVGSTNPFDVNLSAEVLEAPTVNTLAAQSVSSSGAILRGIANAKGGNSVDVTFEYGLTPAFGNFIAATPDTISGTSPTNVETTLSNLQPGKVYYFRSTVLGSGISVVGNMLSFTTLTTQQQWNSTWFGSPSATGIAAPSADPNRNGAINLVEYALGGNPILASLPAQPIIILNSDNVLEFEFVRLLDRTEVVLTVQGADHADGPWMDLAVSTNGAACLPAISGVQVIEEHVSSSTRRVKVRDIYPSVPSAQSNRFMRLKVSQ